MSTSPSSNSDTPSSSSPSSAEDSTDQMQQDENAQTPSELTDEPEQDRLDQLDSPPKQVKFTFNYTRGVSIVRILIFNLLYCIHQPLAEFNDNSSDEQQQNETESSAIENHTSTDNVDEATKQATSSVSLKKVKLYWNLVFENFTQKFIISQFPFSSLNLQCLVDYEGDSDDEDDEDSSHMSKKARIE